MAAAMLGKPGTKFGPCANVNCGHQDCAENRRTAEAGCEVCTEPIGYGKRYYVVTPEEAPKYQICDGPVHAACLENLVDKQRAKSWH